MEADTPVPEEYPSQLEDGELLLPPEEEDSSNDDETIIEAKVWTPKLVTIEPVLILFSLGGSLLDLTMKPLIYHKICMRNFPQNICLNLHNETYLAEEKQIQSIVSYWLLYHQLVYYVPSFVLTFTVYGSLSDKVSRRASIALPAIGHLLQSVIFLLTSIFIESHVGYTLIGPMISGLAGGWVSFYMAVFSYLGETSAPDRRTYRVSLAEGYSSVSGVISMLGGGVLLDHTSYTAVFSITCGLYALGPIYVYLYMLEPPRPTPTPNLTGVNQSRPNTCRRLWNSLKDSLTCVFRHRPNNGRARLLVCFMVIFTATSMILHAYNAIGYLYLRRQPLSWTQTLYGIFSAVLEASSAISFLLIVPLLKICFHLSDTTLMIIGLLSSMVSVGYFGFCSNTWMVFFMPILNLFSGGLWAIRSFVSQLVESHEQGRMFAVFGTLQAASGMVSPVIFNTIYPLTLSSWPGFPFLLAPILAIVPLAMLCWLYCDVGKTGTYTALNETDVKGGSDSVPMVAAIESLDEL